MTMNNERIFIVGGTGTVGAALVRELLAKNVPVTLFARSSDKVNALFSNNSLLNVVEGDYNDLTPLKEGVKGHTRLFLLVMGFNTCVDIKIAIATYAYEAGVRQVVDISSLIAGAPWRMTSVGSAHRRAEQGILNIPNRGSFVALRPGNFMSNMMYLEYPKNDTVIDTTNPDEPMGWISPDDIAAVAAVVLTEDIEKHRDAVYELNGDIVTGNQRVDIFSRATGRPFSYKRISMPEKYKLYMDTGFFSHLDIYDLLTKKASYDARHPFITDGIEILLGRKPETLEQFIFKNKHRFE
ncbi:hypothetical protein RMATCC62417_17689 [Rhizopus microsporus]|nr:hypothetical protein RMATCC62417_17689 [Rhizopus microsporus]